jgi:ribosomal protein S21
MAEIKRKRGETFESLLRRFTRKVQQSGRLIQAKKIRFFDRPESQSKKRADALRRLEIQEEREYLKKIGKLKDEPERRRY